MRFSDDDEAKASATPVWNQLFDRVRWLNVALQWGLVVALPLGWFCESHERLTWLVVLSTLAELCQWFGHLYFPRSNRRLPFYCPWWQAPIHLHRFLSVVAVALLLGSLFQPRLLPAAVLVLIVVCLLDLWRLLYLHYWVLLLVAAVIDAPSLPASFSVVLGSIYAWSGFFKLTSRAFHEQTALFVFQFVFQHVTSPRLRWLVSVSGVLGEMLIGIYLLGFVGRLPLDAVVGVSVVAMHAYIVVGIGLANGIRTFVSWNLFCAIGSCCCLGTAPFHWSLLQWALALVLNVPPVLQLFGRNEFPTLSHSYFVPNATGGPCYLLFDAEHRDRLPKFENGVAIEVFGPESTTARALAARARLGQRVCALSGSWVDVALRLDEDDPYNETFGAGPVSFFRCIRSRFLADVRDVWFVQIGCGGILRPRRDRIVRL